jgi:dynein heavy chain
MKKGGKPLVSSTLPPSMFRIDKADLVEFALPQRATATTMLPKAAETRKSDKTARTPKHVEAVKEATVTQSVSAPLVEESEFSFLPKTMGKIDPKADGASGKLPAYGTEKAHAGTETAEEDEVDVIMAGIKTSDDAINFFARFGSETPVKFVHLVHDRNAKTYSPYDLVAAKEKDHEGEHFTMSPMGIVHVCPGEVSECTALSAWMRQGMMFKILRNIPFYKFYLHRKCFTVWKENVRFLFFAKQRRKLADRMFFARKNSCDTIVAVKRHLIEIQNVRLLNLELKTHQKDEFMAMQSDTGIAANAKFEEVIAFVTREVEHIMEEVTTNYSLSKQDPNAHSMGYGDANGEKAKSLVKIKQEKAEKKVLRARAKLEHSTLSEFIRLVDYMVVETLVSLAVDTTSAFHDELIKPRKTGVFETMVRFSASGTAFSPTCLEVRDMIDRILENMINFVGGVNRVRHLGTSKNTSVSGPNIQSIVRENKQFRRISDLIQQRVIGDYDKAEEHAQAHESVRPIYDFNETWDYAAYSAQSHDISSLKAMLELIGNWGKELEKLRNKPIGVLEVDSKRLKGELNPLKEARLQEIKEYIKDEARYVAVIVCSAFCGYSVTQLVSSLCRGRCLGLLEKCKDGVAKLSNRPTFLKDYAHQVSVITALRDQEKSLYKQTSQVDQMYNLLRQYDVKVPSEDLVLHEDLHDRQAEYRKEVDAAQSFRDSKMSEMVGAVATNIAKLQEQITGIVSRLEDEIFVETEYFDDPERTLEELSALGQRLDNADQLAKNYAGYQRLFGVPEVQHQELESGKEKFELIKALWETVNNWSNRYKTWNDVQFTDLQVEEVDKEVQVFFKESFSFHKKLGNKVSEALKDKISDFKAIMPNVMDLGNPNMRPRHWEKLFKLINENYYNDMPFNMAFLIKAGIMNYKDAIQETSACASGEAQLEDSLEKIRKGWDKQAFTVLNHRDQHGLFILGSLEDIFTLLEDNQVTLQTMLGSRYIRGIQERVDEWEKKLSVLSETLDEWLICQRTWMYLENIFGAEDIQKQLPAESQKFLVVDRAWKTIMTRTNNDPKVLSSLNPLDNGASLLDTFLMNNEALESIQKSLEQYLETKRMAFPRFYFLSNDELLEILSQTRDPHAVQPHMGKCFDAIKRIKFGEGRHGHDILGFLDPSGEYVPLTDPVKAEGPVETWLLNFEKGMRNTLYDMCKSAYTLYPSDEQSSIYRKDWLWSYPAQVVICIDQVLWTFNTSEALMEMEGVDGRDINPQAMEAFLNYSLRQIDAMVDLVRAPLDKQQRMCLGALLTIDVHARDVIRSMVAKKVGSLSEFEWTKQLRYYWEEKEDDVFVKQTNSSFRYGYEYLGNCPRLVITPLTDTCYMTLTGALHMRLGGAPAGPAGTGKTETTKDLAKALAVYCVVFNCSDGLDYKIMGRFFSGLAQQGAWACFDEFNRIDIEVLSVIAQQILCIQQAIVKRAKIFDFEGQMIPLNYAFGVFITMNPGYAGRTELPDNLKSLFRPVAMMVPDYRLIAEIMLFAEGFANALPLSNKMAQLYALASEQLSKQAHYDFGMRAVKSVLVAAGQLKRKEPETNEDILLIRAMRDSNVPKFLEQDLPLFGGILSDLFPGIKVPFVDYGKLQTAIERTLDNLNLQRVPTFITKVIQVHETQLVRHGMMVVGEAGSGKTTNVKVLSQALGLLYEEKVIDKDNFYKIVDRLVLNPKSITAGELYGEFNVLTNEWKDGIVPKLVRDCVNCLNEGSENRKWIIFDGPVDAVWIENMNTVLDDNKTLCLANSERIKLPATLHMLFEVQDLKVASPATVSRCGMVYMEQVHVGITSVLRTWGATDLKGIVGVKLSKSIVTFIEGHLDAAIECLRFECKEKVATSNNQLTASLCNLIAAKFRSEAEPKLIAQDDDLVQAMVVWCFVWSIGGNIHDASRPRFGEWMRLRFGSVLSGKYNSLLQDIYGCFVDLATKEVKPWTAIMPKFKYDASVPFFGILVPTVDTTRYRYLLDKLMNDGNNVLFMAETGVGKSVVVNSFLNEMVGHGKTVSYVMGYSAQTKPANLRDVFETKLEKKRKNLLGPPAGKRMFMFIDDLNMPALEKYGAQPPNELLRQVIDQGGFYDVQKLFFKNVQDLICVSACAPPGGGRNEVSPRLLRHFSMIWLTNLTVVSMCRIFTSILQGFIEHYLPTHLDMAAPLVGSSVDIYMRIQKELLPTPLRSHYTFNLRDLSKVFQGMLMVKPKHLTERSSLIRLWCHESARVFRDRLINEDDRAWFNQALLNELHNSLNAETWTLEDFSDCLYGNFMTRTDREYQELKDRSKVGDLLVEYLEEYNMSFSSRMELVFFRDAVNHVARIARVLSQPRGNALLVGVGGSGRQSLTRMAAFMADYKCRQIEITRGYGMVEWHDNLKDILMSAGCKNLNTVFLFSDTQIVTETFLEDINNILNSGEVPNLYETDELEKIVAMVRPLAKAAGKLETREAILQHYIHLVRENLHIVLCMSPIGAGFRTRCRMFPSLVNCCTIDWFNAWPEDALYSVAHKLFESQHELGIGEYVEALSTMCNKMHRTVEVETQNFYTELKRYNYTTPTSYLELVKLYVDVLKTQQQKISLNEKRYRVGLDKLRETEEIVAKLEEKLTAMQPVLEKAAVDTATLLKQVTEDQADADAQAAVVEVDVQEANKVAAGVKVIKDDCQADLDEAMPAYESAVKALATLDKKSIQEMKAFNNPPEMVKFTLEAVCILLDVKPDWGEAKKLLSQMDFMDTLKGYDKDNINPKIIKKVEKYYKDPRFMPEDIKKQSSAAMCLCMWVRAMVVYDKVAKGIEPKKLALKEAEDSLAATMAVLNTKKAALQTVLDRVANLQRTLRETQQKKADLEAQAATAKKQMERAGLLLGGLGGEKIRWQESAKTLNKSLVNLVGDMCLAAGCLAYLGPFTAQFRRKIVDKWMAVCRELKIPCGEFTLLKALAVPVVVRGWQIDGLPADDFSCENGLLTTMGRRWPLMIDPQGQANRWLRNMYASKNLQIIKLTEKDFLRTLENGIRYGAPVLLENVGQELDPSLEPVLLKQVFKRAGQLLLRLGDTDVPYSDEFKFMITTKLANPHYMPEICIKVTVINFTVTMRGLEDQLLVDVIKNERPDLEERRDALVVSIANDQRQLLEIEEQILSMLANASGNILDDEELINALARSKKTSSAINVRLSEAETTTQEINDTREGYRVVATRGSVIYFVVANLALVDPMYQYSLQYYKELVVQRLQKTEKKDVLQERLDLLVDDITRSIYTNVCRGLFEKDKLLYSFMIAVSISLQSKAVSDKEWLMFMVGAVHDATVLEKHPLPEALGVFGVPEKSWFNAVMLEHELPAVFSGLCQDMRAKASSWADIFKSESPHSDLLPGGWETSLNDFQRMLLIRFLREEKVVFAIRRYVAATIGDYYTESPPFDLEGAYNDSTSTTPLIFILSPGADPTDYLLQLAASKGKEGSGLRIISLGQGQGPIAERAIDMAQKSGDWVCLQNCHLAVSWLSKLELTVERMQNDPDTVNREFRIWLTSMPSDKFPVPVLQNGIKVTNEPPRGLKANLTRTFNDISPEEYEASTKPDVYKKMIFATAFFNALILERRKFGAVGWNIPYDWMNSDLKAAMTQVKMYVEEQATIPWETLNVSVADITYGGRVTDAWDKRSISSILRKYFCPKLMKEDFHFTDDKVYFAPSEGTIHVSSRNSHPCGNLNANISI